MALSTENIENTFKKLKTKPLLTSITLIVIFFIFIIGTYLAGFWGEKGRQNAVQDQSRNLEHPKAIDTTQEIIESNLVLPTGIKLPQDVLLSRYEMIIPIIDSTLFVGRSFSELLLGGVNIEDVEVAIREVDGQSVDVEWNKKYKSLSIPCIKETITEFRYKEQYYRIQIVLNYDYSINHVIPVFSVSSIAKPYMTLKAAKSYISQ